MHHFSTRDLNNTLCCYVSIAVWEMTVIMIILLLFLLFCFCIIIVITIVTVAVAIAVTMTIVRSHMILAYLWNQQQQECAARIQEYSFKTLILKDLNLLVHLLNSNEFWKTDKLLWTFYCIKAFCLFRCLRHD